MAALSSYQVFVYGVFPDYLTTILEITGMETNAVAFG
jgi:hypothetical protein